MKMKNMKSTVYLRTLLSLLLLTALLISAFCLTVSAAEDEGVQWAFVDDERTKLSGDGVIYEQVTLPLNCGLALADEYVYMNNVDNAAGSYIYVRSYEKSGYLVYIQEYSDEAPTFYCRSDMLPALQDYFMGTAGRYVLRAPNSTHDVNSEYDKYYDLTDNFSNELKRLPQSGGGVKTDVTTLKDQDIFELRLMDKSGLLTTLFGAVYEMPDGSYGYVDYTTLDNSHFDADGNFSYRQGTVTVYPVENFKNQLKQNSDGAYRIPYNVEFERDEYRDDTPVSVEDTAIGAFWFVFVLGGYLLPIAPLVIGLVFANSKKMSHPRRWYIVVGMAALWLVLAILLTVLLLV